METGHFSSSFSFFENVYMITGELIVTVRREYL